MEVFKWMTSGLPRFLLVGISGISDSASSELSEMSRRRRLHFGIIVYTDSRGMC